MSRKINEIDNEDEIRDAINIIFRDREYVSAVEIWYLMRKFGDKLSDEEVQDFINQTRTDGDGKIRYEDFLKVMGVYCDVRLANYSLECPERPHWKIRADSVCNGTADKYHCLYDPNNENITEFCDSPKDYTAGFMAVYRGNIDADLCPGYRYMPINFKSNIIESCIFLKSKCNGEGQLVHHNWSLAEDTACTCDFSNGYAFIQKPKSNCYCVPSQEDCSCYKKQCGDSNYVLSPGLVCLIFYFLNGYKEKNENDTMNDISPTVEDRNEITTELPKKFVDDNLKANDYFSIHCEHTICQFYDGNELQSGYDEKPRILDMCFVNLHKKIYIVYIDADNKMIVIRDISNKSGLKEKRLPLEPNRLAKIDNNTIGVIYKKKFDILIFDVNNMKEIITHSVTQGGIMDSKSGIQGILALSETEFILSDKIHLYRCKLETRKTDAVVTKFAPSVHEFDTARRLTHVTLSQNKCQDVIFIADENDKKLTSIGRKTGRYIKEHEGQNRGLQNVRAIGATENRVYAATSAGISVFSHNEGTFTKFENQCYNSADYRMLLDYKYHVEHTRSLCIHLDKGYIYIGLSCVIKQNDVIVIFRFKPNDTFE
ncbi:CALM [Mytilus coruscus]|uniref:Sulfhydryl light chain n=1 Tax=Mytilus coruscus TaxID=42192 RepID=A0A6J8DWS6_MYTCO|nr:CALM [Mytilus coruscus]